MAAKRVLALAAATLMSLATPADANVARPEPVLSHDNLDRMENNLGLVGLIGLIGLLGLRQRDKRG